MFKPRICSWIGLLPLFMLSLPVQAGDAANLLI